MLPAVPTAIEKVTVVGAGSWGTALAALLAENAQATLWARSPALAEQLAATRENGVYLPGVTLAPEIVVTADLEAACRSADLVVMAVPSHGFRGVLGAAAPAISASSGVLSVAKGVEQGTRRRMTEIVDEVLPGRHRVGVLTGPNLALEIAAGQPAASVVASRDATFARDLQGVLMTARFRVYTNPDVIGCEIAGAMKNVIAIAAGVAAGLGYGDNARAALITRGLAELARLGVALGGDPFTFSGLAGMGDLVATCASPQSRNRSVGVELGLGRPLAEILAETRMVAEGVNTTAAVLELAASTGVEMPIATMVGAILSEGRRPSDLVPELMLREAKPELHGLQ